MYAKVERKLAETARYGNRKRIPVSLLVYPNLSNFANKEVTAGEKKRWDDEGLYAIKLLIRLGGVRIAEKGIAWSLCDDMGT